MKLSRFNIIGRAKDDPNGYLLYNTLHDHRILFEDPDLNPERLFARIRDRLPLTEKEVGAADNLFEMGILVADDADERKVFEDWHHHKIRERVDRLQVTILPTMNCNLACRYCFENEVRQTQMMTPETADVLTQWLIRRIDRVRPETVHLTYFGGEPLLHPGPIRTISRMVGGHCQREGIPFEFGMITNGVRLTPEFVDEMLPYGFQWVKITFDGDREAHDKKRVHHGGKGTFDEIYNNLSRIHGKLKIAIGGNFDDENYAAMFPLLERLKASPFAGDIMVARFKPIMKVDSRRASQREGTPPSLCQVCSFNDEQVHGIVALQRRTEAVGLPIQEMPEIGPCEYHSRHSFTIGPDGLLYNCPAFVGLKNLAGGDVFHDEQNPAGEQQLAGKKWDEDCESCSFLPNCAGGCRYNSLNRTGDLNIKSCEVNYLKAMTEEFMQREIGRLRVETTRAVAA